MISFIIPLLEAWLPVWSSFLVDVLCLGFIAFVGCFLHSILRR